MGIQTKTESMLQQTLLFGESEPNGVQIASAAKQLNVSSATIRNWLKTGYLGYGANGTVDSESINFFLRQHAGKEKLVSRANKSLKDSHDHSAITTRYIDMITSHADDLHALGYEYQDSLSDAHRNKEGIYYTPEHIVADILTIPKEDVSEKVFCDPCCGSGNFILRALEVGFRPENIVGYDTDPVAVELTKNRIRDISGYVSQTIYNDDFLEQTDKIAPVFDYIFTNPPWGKKLPKEKKDLGASVFDAGKSSDTCSLFFFACLKVLNQGGRLGLLLPEAFFNIATYETARKAALRLVIERLMDYKKPFKGIVTRAQAIILRTKAPATSSSTICCESDNNRHERKRSSFAGNPKAIINFHCNSMGASVIDHAFRASHITLEHRASWGLGIVTGNNKKWIRSLPAEDYVPVFKGSDIATNKLKEATSFIPANFALYQQVAPIKFYQASEKLIYRFISSNLCFFADSEQRYILNSANMMIPNADFPITCSQLASLLNSSFMNWLFKSIYNTHKILRGDLEALPIHVGYFDRHHAFDEHNYLNYLGIERDSNGAYRIKE